MRSERTCLQAFPLPHKPARTCCGFRKGRALFQHTHRLHEPKTMTKWGPCSREPQDEAGTSLCWGTQCSPRSSCPVGPSRTVLPRRTRPSRQTGRRRCALARCHPAAAEAANEDCAGRPAAAMQAFPAQGGFSYVRSGLLSPWGGMASSQVFSTGSSRCSGDLAHHQCCPRCAPSPSQIDTLSRLSLFVADYPVQFFLLRLPPSRPQKQLS
mmetsp:Transcript_67195/g.151887  ORF Transcript_67195/g.151887 Transcript_67195/m.151887 type:complete len:211 (+) Transcript_67195:1495-2127(+)